MENSAEKVFPSKNFNSNQVYAVVSSPNEDVNLTDMLVEILGQWRLLVVFLLIGIALSTVVSYIFAAYSVEAVMRRPTIHELGQSREQKLIELSPEKVFSRFADIATSPSVHLETLKMVGSGQADEGQAPPDAQVIQTILNNFSLQVQEKDHYQLGKEEKRPFKEVVLALKTGSPEWAATYLDTLIKNSIALTRQQFSEDASSMKASQLSKLQATKDALSRAETKNRMADIDRKLEANNQSIAQLQQQISIKLKTASEERKNRIVHLEEAWSIAKNLGIQEPVTWDDLRATQKSSQIINELGDSSKGNPLYFRGTRLIRAELDQLLNRASDRPFISGLISLESEIEQKRNDMEIEALRSRPNDEIYIEKYAELNRQVADLEQQSIDFSDANFAVVIQPPTVPSAPVRNPQLIILVGAFLAVLFGLAVAIIRIALQKRNVETPRSPVTPV